MAIPYATEFRLLEQAWAMTTAKNLAEMRKALEMRQYMSQNIMVGTVDGDIFYLGTGACRCAPRAAIHRSRRRGVVNASGWASIRSTIWYSAPRLQWGN